MRAAAMRYSDSPKPVLVFSPGAPSTAIKVNFIQMQTAENFLVILFFEINF
jgi:hypothetical protein